jgi:beta-lactamase regulating signal transducer with metallopeptidase domain
MILEWMAYAALCAALVGLAARCIDGVFASMHRARRGIWIIAIAISTVIPFALPLRAHKPTAAPQSVISDNSAPTAGTVSNAPSSNRTDVIVLTIWALASGAFAVILLLAHRRTTAALDQCRRTTVAGSPAFVSSDFGPAVVGVLRHRVVVPSWTLALPDEEQRLVVAHELEHARSGDPVLAFAGVCAVVVMPWNAALWWQLSRLRLAIELDCDARVVARTTGDAVAYSKLLVSVSERALATRQPVLAMSRSRSALAKRFDALLSRQTLKPRRAAALSALAMGIVASVAFVPAPHMADIVDAIRVREPVVPSVPVSLLQKSDNRATFTPPIADRPGTGIVQRQTGRATPAKSRYRMKAIGDVNSLPPVSVVPSTQRGPLDSVVVSSATLPPVVRRGGGIIMASPGGGRAGGAFRATATATPIGMPGTDSNRVIRGGRGGRAVLVPRPDTTSRN